MLAREHLGHHRAIGVARRHRPEPPPDRLEHLERRVGQRRVREPGALDVRGERARGGDEDVVARAPAGVRVRDQRAEVPRCPGRGEQDPHLPSMDCAPGRRIPGARSGLHSTRRAARLARPGDDRGAFGGVASG